MGDSANWWRDAVVYEVCVRSFADADGDGTGDLAGLRSRLGYLAELGVDAVWTTPWYRSPMVDGGYDVEDHRSVDPLFGTDADADAVALVTEAHRLGLRVLVDVVPNHTSDRHRWFRHVTRFGRDDAGELDLALGTRRARAALLLMLALPGGAYLYQGEELGLAEVEDLPEAVLADPTWERSGHTRRGRDGCRVPLPALGDGTMTWSPAPAGVLSFTREPGFGCVVNLAAGSCELPGDARVLLASGPLGGGRLPPDTAVWLAGS
ncbi:alpha-amylase family glycosyl hydrolase [Amycolatopsis sp. NPDC026612]|uniref:alpha-amylase family glycosyl hydrolase n=1 Tax=Amycolatopsis sp. NPDC026612 TaxID=3155466 RepID=UPI0033F96AC1